MKLLLSDLHKFPVSRVVIESVDLSLYIAHAQINGVEHVIAEKTGRLLKKSNLLEMRKAIQKVIRCKLFLRHNSAFDEMIGHHHPNIDNCLELPLDSEALPVWYDS